MPRTPTSRSGHPRLDPPPEVREIAATLERAGFEAWCVGGAVRDALLGLPHLDWDLATSATPTEIKRAFRRTVPVGEKFGTIGVLDRHGRLHEVTTFRRDVQTDGRHAVVEFGASLDDDLARRDFTMNAIAYSPRTGELRDPYLGQEDLSRGVVRAVGVARDRMVEDRLRALRALRFAGRFGFRIEPETWSAIVESAPFLPRLSRERIKQELEKTMEQVVRPSRTISLWHASGALRVLIPRLDAQPAWALHAADGVAAPGATPHPARQRRRALIRLATLFVGMEREETLKALRDLRFSNRDVEWLSSLAVHATSLRAEVRSALAGALPVEDARLRRWAADCGRTRLGDTLRVVIATLAAEDALAGSAPSVARAHVACVIYRRALRVAYRDPVEIADLGVDGEDLMTAGLVRPGPSLGALLRHLRDAVVDDPSLNQRDTLLAIGRAWASARDGG